ncbi:hypothetical protein [Pseudomarimonas salicorniae]|uniref:Uncharacterized protein n=1 Tax=Pseudomarimonas salicorniae TaxID=2933270 RepID=A0ABT0GDT5_9GAMM|nr:hypothetical protein [Lysobacter sp. CAU 1642]MCK7592721.1 hypothetical protein [Lysobacter sp. CAU 1642]
MILRRIAQQLREQNWAAIAIEFVLLIVGVFLGIQVANWNEDRQQVARQAQYMERLRVDFEGIRDRIREHFAIYRDAEDGGDYLLELADADSDVTRDQPVDEERLSRAYNALTSLRIPPPLPATYVEMRSEGQLSYIANPALRDSLAEYDRLLGVLQEVSRVTADNLIQQSPTVRRYFNSRTVRDPTALSSIRIEVLGYDLEGMRADRDFTVAIDLLQRYAINSSGQRELQLALVEDILDLIDAETAR